MKISKLTESGQPRSNRFNTYKKRIERAIEKGDQETLQRTKEAIMYAPAKELSNSEAADLMDMIKSAKLEEALTGYKLTIVKDGETFDDYACAYEEAGAIQQMKNKYGDNIEIKDVAVSKVIKESKSIKTFGAKGEKLDEARDPYFTPYGYRDAAKVLNGKAPEYYYHLKEIEMAQGDGRKLANYAKKLGLNVVEDPDSDPDYPEFYILGKYHWNDYFYPYPSDHEPKLTEDADVVVDAPNKMQVEVFSGLNADGFAVHIYSADDKLLFTKDYRYGHNASYTRKFAEFADKDYEDSIKYNWKNKRVRKPFIADIINDLAKEYNVSKENIEVIGGQNKFSSNPVDDETVARFKQHMNESIEVATIADYISDHYEFDDIDDKYGCINSIRDSHKDTISKEELEQFIGAHNGKDKVNEDIDYSKFRDIPDLIPYEPFEDTRKWQYSVGGVDVPYTSYEDAKAHLKDDYNIEDYREELQAYLDKETGRPQKFFVDATFDGRLVISIHWGDWKHEHNFADFLVRKFFMDKGLGIETDVDVTEEDGRDTYSAEHYYQINDIALSGRVIEESAATHCVYFTQDGKDQVEFEGTEDECNKYIKDIQAEQDDEFGDEAPERFIKKLTENVVGELQPGEWVEVDLNVKKDGKPNIIPVKVDKELYHGYSFLGWAWGERQHEYNKSSIRNKIEGDDVDAIVRKYSLNEAKDVPLYVIKDSHGNQLSAPNPDDSELWDRVESMEARGRRGLMVVAYTGKKVNEASYGGAFDVEDDQYFTRDDLLYFADEVLGHVSETFNGLYDIGGVWFENGCVVTQIVSEDGNMYEDTTKVDMRKIREPWHLKKMYAFPVAANIIKQISDTDGDVVVENIEGQGKYSDKFYAYLRYIIDSGDKGYLSYLASQLIRYCKEEDLQDLWNDRMGKVAKDSGFEDTEDALDESVMDEFHKAQRYLDYEIPEVCLSAANKLPDMTEEQMKVLNTKCANFHGYIENVLFYMHESLNESVTDAETIEAGPAVGMAAVISDLIKDEYEAIDGYNSAIATAEAEGFEDAVKVLTEIQAEENIHIGQLQEVMKMFDPNADKVEEGQAEGAEQLNNSDETPNNNIEESADMKKERWEEIYDSFKTVEKELNQDGEAVTAVIDQMYNDNKEDPDYKKAYDKWAFGN